MTKGKLVVSSLATMALILSFATSVFAATPAAPNAAPAISQGGVITPMGVVYVVSTDILSSTTIQRSNQTSNSTQWYKSGATKYENGVLYYEYRRTVEYYEDNYVYEEYRENWSDGTSTYGSRYVWYYHQHLWTDVQNQWLSY